MRKHLNSECPNRHEIFQKGFVTDQYCEERVLGGLEAMMLEHGSAKALAMLSKLGKIKFPLPVDTHLPK
jgi:hypothetical protein